MKYDMGRYTNSFLEAIGSPMFDCYMDWMAPNGGKLSASEAISSSKAKVFCVQGGKDVAVPPDSLSVYGNKDRIANPNFTTYFSPNAGHHGVWRSDASRDYVKTVVDPAYQAYQAKHPLSLLLCVNSYRTKKRKISFVFLRTCLVFPRKRT